jgi:hypothetical protein
MTPINTKIKFDEKRNAVIVIFNGRLDSVVEIENTVEELGKTIFTYSESRKVWCIADFTGVIPSGYSVRHFIKQTKKKLVKIFKERTLGGFVVVKENPTVTIFVSLFGNLVGTKAHFCKTYEEATHLLDKLSSADNNTDSNRKPKTNLP